MKSKKVMSGISGLFYRVNLNFDSYLTGQ